MSENAKISDMKVGLDLSGTAPFVSEKTLSDYREKAAAARETLVKRNGPGAEFTGWIDLPVQYDREEFRRIKEAAESIRNDSEVFLSIGIGGSYLGARSANEFLHSAFYNQLPREKRNGPEIYYLGSSLSGAALERVLEILGDRDFSVNVISKSGTTTEPAVAFRIIRELAEKKYGKAGAAKRIYATTDRAKGALKTLADEEGYETFVVPDDIGGRYSVLTAVGLLPIAVAGTDIDRLMAGAGKMREHCLYESGEGNLAISYAAYRNCFYDQGKNIEILASFDPDFLSVAEWWKQLFGESEGKDGKGLFPASVTNTTDLHSVGQYIQDGRRAMIETMFFLTDDGSRTVVRTAPGNADGLDYLAGKDMTEINRAALLGTRFAHIDGGVPVAVLTLSERSPEALGELFYFMEFSCGVSAYLLGVNPFNQPGVESYKRNMFALLGKPGYEKEAEALRR